MTGFSFPSNPLPPDKNNYPCIPPAPVLSSAAPSSPGRVVSSFTLFSPPAIRELLLLSSHQLSVTLGINIDALGSIHVGGFLQTTSTFNLKIITDDDCTLLYCTFIWLSSVEVFLLWFNYLSDPMNFDFKLYTNPSLESLKDINSLDSLFQVLHCYCMLINIKQDSEQFGKS